MRKITYLFILFVCINLMSMDQQPAQTHTETILQAGPLIAVIINPLLFDHNTICSLALTNKYYNKRILETAPQRKEFLTQYDTTDLALLNTTVFCSRDISRRLWHRYGSSYAMAVMVTRRDNIDTTLILLRRNLTGNRNMAHTYRSFENFSSLLDENPAPFFNENGVLSFYGYGIVAVGREYQPCLMRYDLDTALLSSCFPCFLRVKNKNGVIIAETNITRSNLCFLLQNNKISLNSLSATKEKRKRYSYFGESSEECIIIDLIENFVGEDKNDTRSV